MKNSSFESLKTFCDQYNLDVQATSILLKIPIPVSKTKITTFKHGKKLYTTAKNTFDLLSIAKQWIEMSSTYEESEIVYDTIYGDKDRYLNETDWGKIVQKASEKERLMFEKAIHEATSTKRCSELYKRTEKCPGGPSEYILLEKWLTIAETESDIADVFEKICSDLSRSTKKQKACQKRLRTTAIKKLAKVYGL